MLPVAWLCLTLLIKDLVQVFGRLIWATVRLKISLHQCEITLGILSLAHFE